MSDRIKTYPKGDMEVVWQPALCIHSAKCVKGLPEVFDQQARPWINVEGASAEAIRAQVAQCPSGALRIREKDGGTAQKEAVECDVMANGPLIVKGKVKINLPDGGTAERSTRTAFCRCGASGNKPYCDGSHTEVGFRD